MKTIKNFTALFPILCLFTLQGCFGPKTRKSSLDSSITKELNNSTSRHKTVIPKHVENEAIEMKKEQTTPIITIWIHGTRSLTRFTPKEFIFSPQGIKSANEITDRYLIRKIAKKLSLIDPKRFQLHNFYIFGWSGKLSFKERKKAAEDLYNILIKLSRKYYEECGIKPAFRIITHSHGGNVALNMANIKNAEKNLNISELILLACPVQEKTKNAIESPLFKRIYSFFSKGEILQVLDPQGIYKGNKWSPFFSKRTFPYNPKLSQAQIKILGRSILHIEFLLGHFMYKLPAILDALDREHAKEKNNLEHNNYFIIDLRKKHPCRKKYRRRRKHNILIVN